MVRVLKADFKLAGCDYLAVELQGKQWKMFAARNGVHSAQYLAFSCAAFDGDGEPRVQ